MFTLNAMLRKDTGKSASRRLRIINKFPAIIYGGKEKVVKIILDNETIMNMQSDPNFYLSKLDLNINNTIIKVKIQSVQRHPYKPKLYHIDFIRV